MSRTTFHLAPTCQQRQSNADLCVYKQSNQLPQVPPGSVAARATNCTYQPSYTPHQVKTHHHHIFFHHAEVAPRETMPSFTCTFCSKHQDSESIITPMSNTAKKLETAVNIHEYKTSGLGKHFCHPFRFQYKAGTDCKCMAAQCVTVTNDKPPF